MILWELITIQKDSVVKFVLSTCPFPVNAMAPGPQISLPGPMLLNYGPTNHPGYYESEQNGAW